jgi:uncharacterized protein YdiU (UPF0061 family)
MDEGTKTLLLSADFAFDNSYARLPDRFFARLAPTPVPAPRLTQLNENLARELGLDPQALATQAGAEIFAGNRLPPGADPLAMAYAGHQFGNFVPQLGDGRAILLGEVIDRNGRRRDIQLKGSGPTPFSRRGDGRAALGPVLREYIVSEAMAALGIPATRALAAVTTGETIWRDAEVPGAILTRVASSHVRTGTFQYFAARGDLAAVRQLADHVIARLYPNAMVAANPYRAFLDAAISRQAELVAKWLLVGFIHGVMNTDNMSVAGETIDFGPCAFLDAYHPETVFSSIDEMGRYAYANQPGIARWNLARLAETLLPLLAEDETAALASGQEAIGAFAAQFEALYGTGLCAKIGLFQATADDLALARDLLAHMDAAGADYTLTFRLLCDASADPQTDGAVRKQFSDPESYDAWAAQWRQKLAQQSETLEQRRAKMRAANPTFIPRNHRVEEAIVAAVNNDDFAPFRTLLTVLAKPYDDQPAFQHYADPPRPDQLVERTFCGT